MNSQFLPPQQFGGPPQNFPPNRLSPQTGTAFQNVPLGLSKPGQVPGSLPQSSVPPSHIPPASSQGVNSHPESIRALGSNTQLPTGQFSHNIGSSISGGSRLPIPSNQLPPAQDQINTNPPQMNPFNPPTSIGQNATRLDLQPSNLQNGQPQYQNGPLTGNTNALLNICITIFIIIIDNFKASFCQEDENNKEKFILTWIPFIIIHYFHFCFFMTDCCSISQIILS